MEFAHSVVGSDQLPHPVPIFFDNSFDTKARRYVAIKLQKLSTE